MVDSGLPSLTQVDGDNTIAVVESGTDSLYFDLAGGVYVGRFDVKRDARQGCHDGRVRPDGHRRRCPPVLRFRPGLTLRTTRPTEKLHRPLGHCHRPHQPQRRRQGRRGCEKHHHRRHHGHGIVRLYLSHLRRESGLAGQRPPRSGQTNGGSPVPVRSVVYDYYDGTRPSATQAISRPPPSRTTRATRSMSTTIVTTPPARPAAIPTA